MVIEQLKLSNYVANYIYEKNINTVFAISGGASLHLIHSISDHPNLNCICTHHEQAAAIAADGYSRTTGNPAVAITTSGPGATNAITGICCSYYDSVPLIMITGQVSTFRMTGKTGVRQIGFQETPIVDIVKPVVKYAFQIKDPYEIKYQLDKAFDIATSGRKGPVLIDIPDNLQRELLDLRQLKEYRSYNKIEKDYSIKESEIEKLFNHIRASERPIIIAGWGIHLSRTKKEFISFAEELGIPIALTWGASDIISSAHPLNVGTFGTHGKRHANFAVQNADLIISLGSRLDTKSTGSPIKTFAREAKKIVLDIDINELSKFSNFDLNIDQLIHTDLKHFFKSIVSYSESLKNLFCDYSEWKDYIKNLKNEFNDFDKIENNEDGLNPSIFVKDLSLHSSENAKLFIDTGCSLAWMMQKFEVKKNQRVFHDFNNTAMGWALPASIGSYFADKNSDIISIIGDGSFMMSLQELATVKHHKIPLKIFIINNNGYSMIKQTQDQWLESKYYASSFEGGLSFPDYKSIAFSFDLKYAEIKDTNLLSEEISRIMKSKDPVLCNVVISPTARVIPQVKFGKPNEDMEPLLPRDLFLKKMIIKPELG